MCLLLEVALYLLIELFLLLVYARMGNTMIKLGVVVLGNVKIVLTNVVLVKSTTLA